MNAATLVLVPVCAAALIIAALCVARLARAWKMSPHEQRAADEDRAQIALEDEKARLFLTLKDLDGEYAAGKLSEADHAALKTRFQAEAVRVMDDLERHGT